MEDMLALVVLVAESFDEASSPDIDLVGARVQMVKCGFGSNLPPLSDHEHLGLYALALFRFEGKRADSISRRFEKDGVDGRALVRSLWERVQRLYGLYQKFRAGIEARCAELAVQLEKVLPEGLSLLPHQLEPVLAAKNNGWRFLFTDEMGLGKTIQILATMALRGRDAFPIVVASPLALVETWQEEICKWLAPLSPALVELTRKTDVSKLERESLVLTGSYDQLSWHAGSLQGLRAGTLICDECHYLSNLETLRTQSALLVQSTARSVLLATGTLTPNGRHAEAYAQIKMVRPRAFAHLEGGGGEKDWYAYANHFCDPTWVRMGKGENQRKFKKFEGRSNSVELGSILAQISMRRTKLQVFGEDGLPEKLRQVTYVPLETAQRMELARVKDGVRAMVSGRGRELETDLRDKGVGFEVIEERVNRVLRSEAVTMMTALRVAVGRMKIPFAVERVKELLADKHEVLVYCWHNEIATELAAALEKNLKMPVSLALGTMSASQRKKVVDDIKKTKTRVAVLTSAFREGLTLVGYDRLIMLERFWKPGEEMQTEDRIHRILQLRDVAVEYLMCKGTIDDVMASMQEWKEQGSVQLDGSAEIRAYQWLMAA